MRKKSLYNKLLRAAILCPFLLGCLSCQEFVEIDPPVTEIPHEIVFSDDRSATSAIIGIYSSMMSAGTFCGFDMGYYCAMAADEFTIVTTSTYQEQFMNNSLVPVNTLVLSSFWEPAYRFIWYANTAIDGLSHSEAITPSLKQQLLGEARFVRAFCHFYLTNLFGNIPYIESTKYQVNQFAGKISTDEIMSKVIDDLSFAQSVLSETYVTNERVRPNKAVATALLARAYLYKKEWKKAEIEASKLINSVIYKLEDNLDRIFLSSSQEAIWQLMPVGQGHNAFEGEYYVSTGANGGVLLTKSLVSSFELGDKRFDSWVMKRTGAGSVKTYYPFKFKVGEINKPLTEYNMVFRLAEQFLIRAEARAQLDNISGAAADLNVIRERAGLDNTTATTQPEMLEAILKERRVELFTEWGHRWFDLIRTNQADTVLGTLKHPSWKTTDRLFPIPQSEINNNKNLLPQNDGY